MLLEFTGGLSQVWENRMATQWLPTNIRKQRHRSHFPKWYRDKFEAPRVGLEPTTNGLTVTPIPSVWSQRVSVSAVLSTFSVRACWLMLSRALWYGYTNAYTFTASL